MWAKNTNIPVLFWSRVQRGAPDECWPWLLGRDHFGYGRMRVDGKLERGHRIAFWLTHGHWPVEGRHKCDNPPCCNPAHIEDGTRSDNMRDRERRGRTSRGSKYPGHKLTEDNVREARALRSAGMIYRAIADLFGVSLPTIYHACSGRRWKHVV